MTYTVYIALALGNNTNLVQVTRSQRSRITPTLKIERGQSEERKLFTGAGNQVVINLQINKGSKFLKKPRCCVGGGV